MQLLHSKRLEQIAITARCQTLLQIMIAGNQDYSASPPGSDIGQREPVLSPGQPHIHDDRIKDERGQSFPSRSSITDDRDLGAVLHQNAVQQFGYAVVILDDQY